MAHRAALAAPLAALAAALATPASASADVPPPRFELQVRVRDAGACDAKAVAAALRAVR